MAGQRERRGVRCARGVLVPVVLLALAGCGGNQNVLKPASEQEHQIANLWWGMLIGAAVGFSVIVALLLLGWIRRNRSGLPGGGGDRAATGVVVVLGVAVPILVLAALFAWSDVFVLETTAAPNPARTRLTIRVIGHQWWWEVRYPGRSAVTANEIHIPVRTPVRVVVTTDDVVHSFWVPALNRKIDLIPGRRNTVLLEANRPGLYRGQCSEFCGLQHAHMALAVYAEPARRFRAWLAGVTRPARAPSTPEERLGQRVFVEGPCSSCHQIRGTPARARVGPDLTHLQARHTIGALTLPNDPEHLRAWVRNPQDAKPGVKMPAFESLPERDLRALFAYLESLR